MLKRESKKTDSSKIPTLLNVDQNQEKQEVKLFLFIAVTKECCLELLTWYVNLVITIRKLYKNSVVFKLEKQIYIFLG